MYAEARRPVPVARETRGMGACKCAGIKFEGMGTSNIRTADSVFVETPQGIFTASGVWFATTRDALETYASEVLAHEPIEQLIERAGVWLRSPETLAVWLLPLIMLSIPPWPAALSVITGYIAWKTLGPSAVSRAVERVFSIMDRVWLQGAYYVGILSYFAAINQFALVWTGLVGFVVIRWGLLSRIVQPLVLLMQGSLYDMPVPDQVLRAFIIRAAMAHRVSLPHLDRMERQISDTFRPRK